MPLTDEPGALFAAAIPVRVSPPCRVRALHILASSSSANSAALVRDTERGPRVTLIDAGLSPRRTAAVLATLGCSLDHVDSIIYTHLDGDHCHAGWVRGTPRHTVQHLHKRHLGRARRAGLLSNQTVPFTDHPVPWDGACVSATLMSHDSLGVAVFRFELGSCALGYATDLGRPSEALVEALRGVDVLAIESNYCPKLQAASARPEFLKNRIMGGSGHLSNAQCAQTVRAIAPTRRVVLLHLSRDCNRPELAASYHAGAPYAVDVANPEGGIAVAFD